MKTVKLFATVLVVTLLISSPAFASNEKVVSEIKGTGYNRATADVIELGKEATVEWDIKSIADDISAYRKVFKFTLPDDGYIDVNQTKIITSDDKVIDESYTIIYDENGEILICYNTDQLGEKRSMSFREGLRKGIYYIGFIYKSFTVAGKCSAKFTVSFTKADNWEKEDNNSKDRATAIGLNKMFNGRLTDSRDNWSENDCSDYFKISLKRDTEYRIYIDSPVLFGANEANLTFYRPNETYTKVNLKIDGLPFDEVRQLNYIKVNKQEMDGDYYLQLYGNKFSFGFNPIGAHAIKYSMGVYTLDGSSAPEPVTVANDGTIYRLYDPKTGDHIYTINPDEVTVLTAQGYELETSPGKTADKSGIAIYRLKNSFTGEHLFTADKNEVKSLEKKGWSVENGGEAAFYGVPNVKAMYRLFNPAATSATTSHHYTSDVREITELTTKHGWVLDNNGDPVFYLQK